MKTITEIVIDLSGSMKNKLISVKRILREELIPTMDFSDKIGIKVFWSTNKKPIIKELLPISITNIEQLENNINQINQTYDGTPIAAAIRETVYSLKEYLAYDKRIILVTDGKETDGGDYELEAKKARKEGIKCEIHIIGLNLNQQAINKAKKITTFTGGTFSNIPISNSASYNTQIINKSLTSFKTSFPKTTNLSNSTPTITIEKKIHEISKTNEKQTNTKEKNEVNQNNIETNTLQEKVENNSKILNIVVDKLDNLSKLIETLKNKDSSDDEIEIKENKELNNKIGKISEKLVYDLLKQKYNNRVKWLNEKDESFYDHDIEVIDIDDTIEYYIECKGSMNNDKYFYLTKEEWRLFLNNTKNYQIFFVVNALTKPEIIKIDNLLDWILKGKVVPYSSNNIKLKSERILLTILE